MKHSIKLLLLAVLSVVITGVASAATWYVRPDGGTRYSANMTSGQCNGQSDAPYSGVGVNQACAFKDVRYLWQDGSYTTSSNNFPAYGWIGTGGDTYLIRGSIGTGVSYRVGWNNNSNSWDGPTGQRWGVQGDPGSSGAPAPPSGTASAHTRILGENYAACTTASAKTQLHGGFGTGSVFFMGGASYVDLACLDITDFSSCGRSAQSNGCNTNTGQLSDFANQGIEWTNTATNDTLTDINIHGMAEAGMLGATGTGMVFNRISLTGNASSGWNADDGSGATGTGTLLVQNFNISWNGCAEEYPVVDALPYGDCTDDSSGGYGDGFGTATAPSNPAWNVHFDQGVASYNTQDGLDALHLTGAGSSMTITRVLAYSNMGQQIKIGGAAGTAENNVLITNCNAMRQEIPGTPSGYNSKLSDFCRAADGGLKLTVGKGSLTTFDSNTIYSASATGIDLECDPTNGACDSTSLIDYRDNIFVGYMNNTANGYPNGGSGDFSNPIYDGTGLWPFTNQGSSFSHNITFHPKNNWTCPSLGETDSLCVDPQLTDETWHLYGSNNAQPLAGSPVIGTGVSIAGITSDFAGNSRSGEATIGALTGTSSGTAPVSTTGSGSSSSSSSGSSTSGSSTSGSSTSGSSTSGSSTSGSSTSGSSTSGSSTSGSSTSGSSTSGSSTSGSSTSGSSTSGSSTSGTSTSGSSTSGSSTSGSSTTGSTTSGSSTSGTSTSGSSTSGSSTSGSSTSGSSTTGSSTSGSSTSGSPTSGSSTSGSSTSGSSTSGSSTSGSSTSGSSTSGSSTSGSSTTGSTTSGSSTSGSSHSGPSSSGTSTSGSSTSGSSTSGSSSSGTPKPGSPSGGSSSTPTAPPPAPKPALIGTKIILSVSKGPDPDFPDMLTATVVPSSGTSVANGRVSIYANNRLVLVLPLNGRGFTNCLVHAHMKSYTFYATYDGSTTMATSTSNTVLGPSTVAENSKH